jgi:hypothetical protein
MADTFSSSCRLVSAYEPFPDATQGNVTLSISAAVYLFIVEHLNIQVT